MQKLAETCVRRPVFAAVIILILVVVGGFGFTKLGVDRFPRVENPTVTVSASYPGASPEAVETEITDKIEAAVNTIAGIDELRSTSREGQSSVTVAFKLEKNADIATQEVRDKVSLIQNQLPDDVDPPTVRRQDPDSAPILGMALSSKASIRDTTEFADKVLRPQIESADGVGEVLLAGGQLRQINVLPDPYKLRAYGITVTDLLNTLRTQNVEVPGGDVETDSETLTLRTQGRVTSVADFEKLAIKGGEGGVLKLGEVAQIEDGSARATTTAQVNGENSVLLFVRKQSGVNTLATIEGVKARLEAARATFPPGYSVQIVRDQSQYIQAAVHAVEEHLIIGSILATLVVLVFLLNWRATLISAFSIPASIIATFGLLWAFGYTLNIITLLALTLAIGIVIDDAIVVIENIYRVMAARNLSAFDAAIEGTQEIGLAVLATTLSLVAVFLPVAFMEGLTGRLLASFGLTMSFAILVSLLVSFTLAPSLAARWFKKDPTKDAKNAHNSPKFFIATENFYIKMLEWSLGHRYFIIGICLLALAATPTLYSMAPFNFLPEDDESQFTISARAPEGTSLETTTTIAKTISEMVRKHKAVDYTQVSVNGFGGQAATNNADIFVGLKPIDERRQTQAEVMQTLRRQVTKAFAAEGLRIRVSPPNALPGFGAGSGGRGVQFVLSGPDLTTLREIADELLLTARKIPGVADADTNFVAGKPELVASIDRDLAGDLGVNVNDVSTALRFLAGGDQVTTYNEAGEQYEVHLRAPGEFRKSAEGLSLWTVGSANGTPVNLDQIVGFRRDLGPTSIQRLNRQRQIQLQINTTPDASSGTILSELKTQFDKIEKPAGYVGEASGSSKEQEKTAQAFLLAIGLSVIFMYLILAAQFESWVHPITILVSLPLTIPFALLSVVIFGQSLNIYSALGVLLLFGVVKKNSILQVDHTNQLRAEGMPRHDAILQANRDRLRPILMTTIAFVAGMLPLVISSGVGSGTNRAIGTVIFGGQTFSLLLTLLATPVVYSLMDDLVQWWMKIRGQTPIAQPKTVKTEKIVSH